jgi:4-amino-4-deoxy-L-arabinose transferase-like glycosyltransferase
VWFGSAATILICLFGNLGAIGLVGPDEPRYVWIARAMAETGDWVTPRLFGQPWFEKPILYYWATAIGFRMHLPAEWAARLPSAISALAAAIAIGWVARRFYQLDVHSFSSPALFGPLLFCTSVAAIGFSRSASPDMLFSAAITLAMASAAEALRRGGTLRGIEQASKPSDLAPLALFGLFLGLGVLAKGPAAVLLAGGAVFLWMIATGKWRAAIRLAHPIAIAVCCVVALPWYVLCTSRNPDFLHVFIFQHNFERYLTPMFQHRQPFWFFGPIILLALLPWTVLLWPAFDQGMRLWRAKSWGDSPGFFVACWAVFPVIFFSFSQSKLPGYVLPSIPPLALICAIAGIRALDEARASRLICAGLGATWLVIGVAGFAAMRSSRLHVTESIPNVTGVTVVVLGAIAGATLVTLSFARKEKLLIALTMLSTCIAVFFVNFAILPAVDPMVSARSHAEFMRNDQHPDRIFTYQLARSWNWGLAVYFRRELPEWSPNDPEAALVLTTPAGLAEIRKLGRFRGELDEPNRGITYVPVQREPR